jgi:hypothetical protein
MSRWRRRGPAPCELLIAQTCLCGIHAFNPEYFYNSPAEFAAALGEKSEPPLGGFGKKARISNRILRREELKIRLPEHRSEK